MNEKRGSYGGGWVGVSGQLTTSDSYKSWCPVYTKSSFSMRANARLMFQEFGVRIGNRQTIDPLINEEALLFAKFLRGERKTLIPRIAVP